MREWGVAFALFAVVATAYCASPKRALLDSKYALLTSEALITRGSWDLSPYLPHLADREAARDPGERRSAWQLRMIQGRLLYLYPAGTPLLSAAPLAFLRLFGATTLDARGKYVMARELRLQAPLAALLGAAAVLLGFRAARRELPLLPALAVALVAAFGSGYWSVVSRVLWSHSWSVVLLSAALVELLRWEDGEAPRPTLLGLLLVAAFWVRPTNAFAALAFTLAVALWHRRALTLLVGVGAAGCALYLIFSRVVWGSWLPYYAKFGTPRYPFELQSFLGQLLSAEHGLLVFSPILFAVVWALVRFRFAPERRGLVLVSLALVAAYLVYHSFRRRWWGAGAVGPRFLCDLTPFLLWLGAHAWRRARERPAGGQLRQVLSYAAVGALALASLAAHATGALEMREVKNESELRAAKVEAVAALGSPLYWRRLPQGVTARELARWWAQRGDRAPAGQGQQGVRRRRGG